MPFKRGKGGRPLWFPDNSESEERPLEPGGADRSPTDKERTREIARIILTNAVDLTTVDYEYEAARGGRGVTPKGIRREILIILAANRNKKE